MQLCMRLCSHKDVVRGGGLHCKGGQAYFASFQTHTGMIGATGLTQSQILLGLCLSLHVRERWSVKEVGWHIQDKICLGLGVGLLSMRALHLCTKMVS